MVYGLPKQQNSEQTSLLLSLHHDKLALMPLGSSSILLVESKRCQPAILTVLIATLLITRSLMIFFLNHQIQFILFYWMRLINFDSQTPASVGHPMIKRAKDGIYLLHHLVLPFNVLETSNLKSVRHAITYFFDCKCMHNKSR